MATRNSHRASRCPARLFVSVQVQEMPVKQCGNRSFTLPGNKTSRPALALSVGFTLIELLVVIAVIALLAAMLFPVFAKAREKARQTACLSNMNQVGKACLMYSQDYDEMIVPQEVDFGSGIVAWPSLLYPYIITAQSNASRSVFSCPSAADSSVLSKAPDPNLIKVGTGIGKCFTYGDTTSGDSTTNAYSAGYVKPGQLSLSQNTIASTGWKTLWSSARFGYQPVTGVSLAGSQVEDPSGTIQFFDAMTGTSSAVPISLAGSGRAMYRIINEGSTDRYKDAETTKPTYRHSGGFNAVYGDGHAHWRKYGTTTPCEWTIQADPYPTDSSAIAAACRKPS